ncbi:hypothetical protein [Streptomyces hydrogenans]|uniref:hypothetical protein n=1 Tax=Streptomyces hydrogenans TaxID=1873719 RepID=UPI0038064793
MIEITAPETPVRRGGRVPSRTGPALVAAVLLVLHTAFALRNHARFRTRVCQSNGVTAVFGVTDGLRQVGRRR